MRDKVFSVNCCELRMPSHVLRPCSKLMVEIQSQSVNPSVSSGDGVIHANNPLKTWLNNAMEFPYLARLSRRVLAVTATQALSECMFSTAGLTVNQRRGLRVLENVELLLFLRCNWTAVNEWHTR